MALFYEIAQNHVNYRMSNYRHFHVRPFPSNLTKKAEVEGSIGVVFPPTSCSVVVFKIRCFTRHNLASWPILLIYEDMP